MDSLLIENKAWKQDDWLKLLKKAADKLPFKFSTEPVLEVNKQEYISSPGSIGGVELLLQSNGLKVFPSVLPSRKDLRYMRQLVEVAIRDKCSVSEGKEKTRLSDLNEDRIKAVFESFLNKARERESVVIQPGGRKCELKPLIEADAELLAVERKLIDHLASLHEAAAPEVYPVDDKESVIWDGSSIWIDASVKQILFSQKAFKGRLCGQIDKDAFAAAVPGRVWDTGYGMVIEAMNKFSTSDFDAINVRMGEHFEKKEVKKSFGKIEIEAGKLQEISYVLARTVFNNKSISTVTEQYTEQGISKDQMEITAMAVSSMIEVAALNRGMSLEEMHKALIKKTKLTPIAAKAVVDGFVQAATDTEPKAKKKVNWLLISIIGLAIGFAVWYFVFK